MGAISYEIPSRVKYSLDEKVPLRLEGYLLFELLTDLLLNLILELQMRP